MTSLVLYLFTYIKRKCVLNSLMKIHIFLKFIISSIKEHPWFHYCVSFIHRVKHGEAFRILLLLLFCTFLCVTKIACCRQYFCMTLRKFWGWIGLINYVLIFCTKANDKREQFWITFFTKLYSENRNKSLCSCTRLVHNHSIHSTA